MSKPDSEHLGSNGPSLLSIGTGFETMKDVLVELALELKKLEDFPDRKLDKLKSFSVTSTPNNDYLDLLDDIHYQVLRIRNDPDLVRAMPGIAPDIKKRLLEAANNELVRWREWPGVQDPSGLKVPKEKHSKIQKETDVRESYEAISKILEQMVEGLSKSG